MSRFLAIDWDNQRLRVLDAAIKAGQVVVRRALTCEETISPNPTNAEESGRRLRERLKEAGIKPAPVLFCVARERVIFRDVRYPDVPAHEVPAVVHFQMAKELHFPVEEAVVDYAPSSIPGPSGEKRSLGVVLHKDLLTALKKMCQAAGLRLESITARPFGILANWQSASGGRQPPGKPASTDATALLILACDIAEICVIRGSELLFSRACPVGPESAPATLLSEVRRSLAAYAGQFPQHPVQTFFIAGAESMPGITSLAATRSIPFESFDPLANANVADLPVEERGAFAALLGMIQAQLSDRKLPVDFLAAKQPGPPRSRRKYAIAAAAAAVLLFVVAGGAIYGMKSSALDGEMEDLRGQSSQLQKQIEAFGNMKTRLDAVEKWAGAEMVILDELYDLIARFPDQAGIRITRVDWTPLAQTAPTRQVRTPNDKLPTNAASVKPVGRLTLVAKGDSSEALDRLRQALEEEKHWKLEMWEKDVPEASHARGTFKVFRQEPREYQTVLGKSENVTASASGSETERTPDRRGRRPRFPPRGGARP